MSITLDSLVTSLNNDLCNEYKHMLFYMHSANILRGVGRLYLVDKLKEHASSEMGHVFQFAHKIRGLGYSPTSGLDAEEFPVSLSSLKDIVDYAIQMEKEVVTNYHRRHEEAAQLYETTGKHMDIVLFLEEQIEHSQVDVDELVQIQADWKP